MSINLISTPNKIINGLDSRASGALLQLPYVFQRQDYEFNGIFDVGGFCDLAMPSEFGDLTSVFSAGDLIYIFNWGAGNYSDGLYVIQSVSFISSRTRILTDIPFDVATIGNFNNLTTRTNYRVIIEVLDSSGNIIVDTAFRYSPDVTGRLFVDVGIILADYLFREGLLSQVFKLRYQETWDNRELSFGVGGVQQEGANSGVFTTGGNGVNRNDSFVVGSTVVIEGTSNAAFNGTWEVLAVEYKDLGFGTYTVVTIPVAWPGTGSSGGTITSIPTLETPETQATFASLGAYTEAGSNLWENLLRAGIQPIELKDFIVQQSGFNISWVYENDNWKATPTPFSSADGNSNELRTEEELPIGTYWIKINFNMSQSGGDGFLAAGLTTVGTGTITTFSFLDSAGSQILQFTTTAVGALGIQLRPVAGNGTINQFDITSIETGGIEVGKLLTNFKNPFMWRGWKRTVGVLIDTETPNRIADNLILRGVIANVNKQVGGGTQADAIAKAPARIDIFSINQTNNDYFIAVSVRSQDTTVFYSEQLFYEQRNECPEPIMVEFFSSLGVPEQHLFTLTQQIEVTAEKGTLVTTPVNKDLAGDYSRRLGRRLPDYKQQLLLTAESLTLDQLLALQEITYSSEVVLYLNKDGSKTIPVILSGEPVSSYNTKDKNLYSLQITIQLPDNVRFEDIKLY